MTGDNGLSVLQGQRAEFAAAAARATTQRQGAALGQLAQEVAELRALVHRQGLVVQLLQDALQRVHAAMPPAAGATLTEQWTAGVRSVMAQLVAEGHPARESRAIGACTAHTLLTWDGYGAMDEVRAHVTDAGDGRLLAFVLVDPQSPLADAWDGCTRVGNDLGGLLKPLRAAATAARDQLRAAGAYEGCEPIQVTAASNTVDRSPLLVPGR